MNENEKSIARNIINAIDDDDIQTIKAIFNEDQTRLKLETSAGTWLHVAASTGSVEIVSYLIAAGLDINQKSGPYDAGPLTEAAAEGKADVVRVLLEAGVKIDVCDPVRNPLFYAARQGNMEIVKLLLNHGIDASIRYTGKRMKDMDAAEFAFQYGKREIAAVIREHLTKQGVDWQRIKGGWQE